MGHKTEIIDYQRKGFDGIRITPWLLFYGAERLSRRINKKKRKESDYFDEKHRNNIFERRQKADLFRKRHLHNIVRCTGNSELVNKGKQYDAVMVGSDQCWLHESCFGNIFVHCDLFLMKSGRFLMRPV